MFIILFALLSFALCLIFVKIEDGEIDSDAIKGSAVIAMLCALLALILSMIIGAAIISNRDNCDIEYTEYEVIKTDDAMSTYVIINDTGDGAEYTFTYINEDEMPDTAHLNKHVDIVYQKDAKPTCIRKHTSLKSNYSFWFVNWLNNEYTLVLPTRDCVAVD